MKLPSYYEFYNPVKILAGNKAIANLPSELKALNSKNPFIITDKGISNSGILKKVVNSFSNSNIEIAGLYEDVPPDSSVEIVSKIAQMYKDNDCDSIVAVGGGSVIDTSKGVNILVSDDTKDLRQYMGAEILNKKLNPFIVIPTTAGTGSEATVYAVITDDKEHMKIPFISYSILPDVAILDPELTLSLPPKLTAATGMDALGHSIEAYSVYRKNPLSDAYSISAVRLIMGHLENAVKDGQDTESRYAMLNASTIAGVSFSNSGVGIVHALAHSTGSVSNIPHGVAVSIYLPYGMEHNLDKNAEIYSELLTYIEGKSDYTTHREGAEKLISKVRNLASKLNDICEHPLTLKEAGVRKEDIEEIAKNAINDGSIIHNPADMNYEEALEIVKKAYE